MFDPGGVLHAALRAALRRSHECFARADYCTHVPLSCPFRFAARMLREGQQGGRIEKAIHHICKG